jgi:iron(III) transport system substrate-binding protein
MSGPTPTDFAAGAQVSVRVLIGLLATAALLGTACRSAAPSVPTAAGGTASTAAQPATAAGSAQTALSPDVRRLLAAARDNGETELSLSWADNALGGAEGAGRYATLFNRLYGTDIKIHFTPGPSMPNMAAKITQEAAAGHRASSDVYFGTDTHFSALLAQDVLEEYDYTLLSPRIVPEVVAYRNIGVEIYTTTPGVTYNSDLVAASEAPRRLEDVLHPKWQGKIASTQDAAYFDVVSMRPEWGTDRMMTFVSQLSPRVAGLLQVGEESRIVTGEFWLFVMQHAQGVRQARARGAPLGHVVLEDAAVARYGYMGVPRNSVHPNLAKLFIGMIMSEEGQRALYDLYFTDHTELPGSQAAAPFAELRRRGIEPLEIDLKFVLDHPELRSINTEIQRILREKR